MISKIVERWSLLEGGWLSDEDASRIFREKPELASMINRKLEEQKKLSGPVR